MAVLRAGGWRGIRSCSIQPECLLGVSVSVEIPSSSLRRASPCTGAWCDHTSGIAAEAVLLCRRGDAQHPDLLLALS